MNKLIKAVIPVRSGSQRVKNKNFRKFNEKNFVSKVKDLLIRSVDKEELNRDILMSKLKELRQ